MENLILNEKFSPRSAWITAVDFDYQNLTATIHTKENKAYLVRGLTLPELKAFRHSESFGRWFNQHIRDRQRVSISTITKVNNFEDVVVALSAY